MNMFKRKKSANNQSDNSLKSELALNSIHDGVIIADKNGVVQFINPAAVIMTGVNSAHAAVGLDYGLVIKLESKEGRELSEQENPLIQAMSTNQPLERYQASLINATSDKRLPVAISVLQAEGAGGNRVITLRDITKELEEEGEQTEFISTASHEMRTPVATIDGYLSLALNPQTATIDERARGYLTAAEKASKHLGQLFQNLLDVTKLDDGKIKPHFEPVEMVSLVKTISDDFIPRAQESKLNYTFGSEDQNSFGAGRKMQQVVYSFVDLNFMREILDNLIENALKYTPEGGSVYVNVRGDGDRVLINVTDTGIGISADDLTHIFQKFYRVDNSDTRTIGGTGLGLYLVKHRAEAMGGKVWAESAFGEGSTFYVSLPRLSSDEYEKRMIMVRNREAQEQMMKANAAQPQPVASQNAFQVASAPNQISQQPQLVQPPIPTPQAPAQPIAPVPQAPVQPIATQPTQPVQPTQPAQPTSPPVTNSVTAPPGSAPPAPPVSPPLQTNQSVKNQVDININGGKQ